MGRKIFDVLDREIICIHKKAGLITGNHTLHNHDGYEILIYLGGKTNLYTEEEGKELERGDVILIRPYLFHGTEVKAIDEYERVIINLRENLMHNLCLYGDDVSVCFQKNAMNKKICYIHLQEAELEKLLILSCKLEQSIQSRNYGDELLSKAYLIELLVSVNRWAAAGASAEYTSIMPKLIADTFLYIEEHIQEKISISELAKYVNHNSDYLNRRFRQITGNSLQQFVIAKKTTVAQELLQKGTMPTEVCYLVGFNDYSNFSRTFTKYKGHSPKYYYKKFLTI